MKTFSKKRLLKIIAIILCTSIGLELGARLVINYLYKGPMPQGIRSEPKRNQTTQQATVSYQLNSKGFRDDEEVDFEREFHYLFLGDSHTFGGTIKFSETFPEVIERLAQADGIDVQSLNAASFGYNTLHQANRLEQLLATTEIEPDIVILGVSTDDLGNNQYAYEEMLREENSNKLGLWWIDFKDSLHRFFQRSMLYRLARASYYYVKIGEFRPLSREQEYFLLASKGSVSEIEQSSQWEITIQYLDKIVRLTAENDIPLVILYIPAQQVEIENRFSGLNAVLSRYANENGLVFVSGFDAYIEFLDSEAAYTDQGIMLPAGFSQYPDQLGHPGPVGAQVLGEALYDALKSIPLH